MVSVKSGSHSIMSVSRYHPRYQSRSSMYIRGLIPRNFAEFAEAVPIAISAVLEIILSDSMAFTTYVFNIKY